MIILNLSTPTKLTTATEIMKKSAQRRRKHCTLAVIRPSQNFSPRRRPLPGGAGGSKFNQLEMITTFTFKPSLVRIDARNFELSWVTDPSTPHTQTHPPSNRQDRLQYTAPQLAHSVIRTTFQSNSAYAIAGRFSGHSILTKWTDRYHNLTVLHVCQAGSLSKSQSISVLKAPQ